MGNRWQPYKGLCYACGEDKPKQWILNHGTPHALCYRCWMNLVYNKMKLYFKGNAVLIDHIPRIGVCTDCHRTVSSGDIKITHLHHIEYDENNPSANTIELCVRCHKKRHVDHSNTSCLICGSTKAKTRMVNGIRYVHWYRYDIGWICGNCYEKNRRLRFNIIKR